ncbi:MAG: uncharacterized membrane protein YgdD (TMEM256/DUF423 family) [Gammaproteobacteria bacterium]
MVLSTPARNIVCAGALAAAVGVGCGAFGSHALRAILDASHLHTWNTAVHYHLVHALALVMVGALMNAQPRSRLMLFAALALGTGLVLCCGSLYALVLTDIRALGIITPVGGVCFIAGWLSLAAGVCTRSPTPDP